MNTIYLDNHATTQCDPRVVKAMLPYFSTAYGNPSSLNNLAGQRARQTIEHARAQVAALIGAQPHEIVFTSGATESNNLAIFGLIRGTGQGRRNRIVTSAIEHKSVLEPCRRLADEGFEVVELPVDRKGRVDARAAADAINDRILLVSIQAANNEIGTIQNIHKLVQLAHRSGAAFHCDAAQAAGKVPVNATRWGIDFLSLSGHKMHGPKGIGALYVRGNVHNQPLQPLLYGGGQEWGLRPGTENVPAIVGLGVACRIARQRMYAEAARVASLRNRFEQLLAENIPTIRINGDPRHRLPNNSSITFPGVNAEQLLRRCPGLVLSTGSACSCADGGLSHVLTALGLSRQEIRCTVRVGLGRFNRRSELEQATRIIIKAVRQRKATIANRQRRRTPRTEKIFQDAFF